MLTNDVASCNSNHVQRLTLSAMLCSYLQQLIDFEIETAKAKGQYESGVLFLERAVRYVASEVVWQQGQDTTKQVLFLSHSFACTTMIVLLRLIVKQEYETFQHSLPASYWPEASRPSISNFHITGDMEFRGGCA